MSSNHEELMHSYPNPMLDSMPLASKYAGEPTWNISSTSVCFLFRSVSERLDHTAEKAQLALNITCGGLHYPDVLAPWGASVSI